MLEIGEESNNQKSVIKKLINNELEFNNESNCDHHSHDHEEGHECHCGNDHYANNHDCKCH